MIVVGQIGQSLDGRIATPSGHSHYINGEDGLAHLHRLRALMDAVVVGIGTVLADDPQLTVRRVSGPSPARIEGGANTVSRFMAAGCLDRLHIVVAPVVIGSGPAGLSLEPIETMDQALRPPVRTHSLGSEILFDCDLSAQRAAGGTAKKST
jgi:diaminohydroxyphosphoribosylaminopyrimidine deaminase/5-amino-6-(5-phosphoribosylamino)uracil reductase